MFAKLSAVLISNVLYCFSVLVCCRFLVQIGDQNGVIEQKQKIVPCKCDQAQPRGPAFPALPQRPYFHRFQPGVREVSEAIICDRSQIVRSNAARSSAKPTSARGTAIERTDDLAAHLFLSINRTLRLFCIPYVGRRLQGPKPSDFHCVALSIFHLFNLCFILHLLSLLVPSLLICLYIFMFSSYFLSFRFIFLRFNTFQ